MLKFRGVDYERAWLKEETCIQKTGLVNKIENEMSRKEGVELSKNIFF